VSTKRKERGALVTVQGAADLLGVSRPTMVKLIASGILEPVRIAGLAYPRYRRADLERIVREGAP